MRIGTLLSAVALIGFGIVAQAEGRVANLDTIDGNNDTYQIVSVTNADGVSGTNGTTLRVLKNETLLSAVSKIGSTIVAQARNKAKAAHLDATSGNVGSHQIVFVSNANAESTAMGTALIVLKNDGKQEIAYGLYMDGTTDKVELVDAKLVKSVSKADDAKATVVTVEVSAEHYAKAKELVKTYSGNKETLDPPADVILNCATDILNGCGLKPSYRSALRAANPVQWFEDIIITNRKLALE